MTWPSASLSQLCEITLGATPSRSNPAFWGGGNIWVTIGELHDNRIEDSREHITDLGVKSSPSKVVREGTLLFSFKLSIGKMAIAGTDLYTNEAIAALPIRDRNVVSERFLYYALKQLDTDSGAHAAVKGRLLNKAKLETLKIPLPPPSEQRKIVEILDQADALRKLRAEADAKAERILPALFYKMFGDPATNPMGWPTEKLGILFDVVGGGTPSKAVAEYWAGEIPWVSPKDMKVDILTDVEDHITQKAINESSTRLVEKGSVLIVYRSGILIHTFPVAFAGRDLSINQDIKALSSKGEVSNEFLFGLLRACPTIPLGCVKKGATVQNVDGSRFLALSIIKPPEGLQARFASRLYNLLEHRRQCQQVAAKLENLFVTLLQRSFSGELTAKWREAHMTELLQEMEQQAKALNSSNS